MDTKKTTNELDEKIKKTIRKQYLTVALVTVGIAAVAIGIGYLIDLARDSQPRFMLIGLVVSSPLTVWINFGIIKRKLIAIKEEMEMEEQSEKELP